MMLKKDKIEDETVGLYYSARNKRQQIPVSDTIYALDIETSNLFKINGKWQHFDKSIKDYKDIEKAACPYIWMFGIEDKVYYGRDFRELKDVFKAISSEYITKICYIHNLAFESHWLYNIIREEGWTITDMCSRTVKKPIQFKVKELNIIFRCSYMLTNLSLEKAGEEYTNISKRVGDLDYLPERSPLTHLSKKELGYCEYDIRVLYEVVKHFRSRYEHLYSIPITSTSIVRQAMRDRLSFFYIKKQQALVPERHMYLRLFAAFSGGYTHANVLHANRVLHDDIESQDEASAYPAILATEEFPYKQFIKVRPKQFFDDNKRQHYAFLLKLEFKNIKSNYYNHYLQWNKIGDRIGETKADELRHVVLDNGRIVTLEYGTLWCTDIDYDIIRKNYRGEINVLDAYKSPKRYLDQDVIKFILELYKNKTTLKGVKEKTAIYKRDKAMLNSIFGMSVTNPLKQSSNFSNDGYWYHEAFSPEFIDGKLEDMKKSFSTLFPYSTGVWVCSYGRKRLWDIILSSPQMDRDIVYCDTDSCKFLNRENHQDIFLRHNQGMISKYESVCQKYDDINMSDFMPADKNGVLHPIGFFEFDGLYQDSNGNGSFVTMGAKKYCYREKGKLHITVSGVSKKGVDALNDDMSNFTKGFIWDYDSSGKLAVYYHELALTSEGVRDYLQEPFDFEDIDGNIYTCDYPYSVVLMPTTYKLGITGDYEAIIGEVNFDECTLRRCKDGK